MGIREANAEFTALVEALGINIKGAEESPVLVRDDQLRMKMSAMKFMGLDAEILQ